jgi:hypothetical protein
MRVRERDEDDRRDGKGTKERDEMRDDDGR